MDAIFFSYFTIIKVAVAVLIVIALTLLAEHSSPRLTGVISGFPLGAAISLYFIGLENGAEFAAQSAIYASAGLAATQAFVFAYYQISRSAPVGSRVSCIIVSSLGALVFFMAAASLLQRLPDSPYIAFPLSALSLFFFHFMFRNIPDDELIERKKSGVSALLFRAAAAAALILGVTGAAGLIGPKWAGVFSAFPFTAWPLLIIVHYTYGVNHTHSIIKNMPRGLGSLLLYCASLSILYPILGVNLGTAGGYVVAGIYLLLVGLRFGKTAGASGKK